MKLSVTRDGSYIHICMGVCFCHILRTDHTVLMFMGGGGVEGYDFAH